MYEQILVPLKWDPSDEAVLEHVSSLARLSGGRVTLLHVVHSHSRDESAYLETQAREHLGDEAARLTAGGAMVDTRVVLGEPADGISAVAEEIRADLIVMATHGHSEMRHVFVGSVTEDVLRQSGVPVLLVRPNVG